MGMVGDELPRILSICVIVVLLKAGAVWSDIGHITFLDAAIASKGAACLNGSPPAYSLTRGSGSGINNWMIYLEGGAWCATASECLERAPGWLGNSYSRPKTWNYGLQLDNQTYNPDFYNWNRVYFVYCDGSSFLGDVDEVDPKTNMMYRGSRVYDAIMDDLLARGMNNAQNAILSGSSAGALATLLHCDRFRALLPNAERVKCISDSGFFLHAKNLPGAKKREQYFSHLVQLHKMKKHLPASCTSKRSPGLCLFPEYLVEDITTPVFILETSFDYHQLREMLTPYIGGGKKEWHNCIVRNVSLCNSTQIGIMQEFQQTFIDTLNNLKPSASRGLFVHACYLHTHIETKEESVCSPVETIVLNNKSVAQAIADWYFDRSHFQHIDTTNRVPRNCTTTLDKDSFSKKCMEWISEHKCNNGMF